MSSPPGSATTFTSLITALCAEELDFVICGGVACVLQGVARVTADLDIAIDLSQGNVERLVAAARRLRLTPRIPEPVDAILDEGRRRDWIERKGARVFTLLATDSPLQLDVFLTYPIGFDELKDGADRMSLGANEVLVSSREDLIRAKQVVQPVREVDERDIRDLRKMMGDES